MCLFINAVAIKVLLIVDFVCVLPFSDCKPPVFTGKEKTVIDKLRSSVEDKLTATYMKSDAYLVKWLKAKRFDHSQAKAALEKTLEWRKTVGADTLPLRDFGSDATISRVFDFSTAKDTNGNPVVLGFLGNWDFRKHVLEGKINEVLAQIPWVEETAAQLSYNATGDPTSMFLANILGFSVRKHACAGCVQVFVTWVRDHEVHYPYNFYRMMIINNPRIFEPILNVMRPFMTESTRDGLRILGYDRAEQSRQIGEFADLNLIPTHFGGNKKQKI